ncbi:HalOD1 output domain-containing protein [Natrarchaeobius oligotrophus]|uniref:Halobacterial output domain-containing protein n=1 Tax=Natrarchaeobius chitinivorans TaxID=1679083 RepID=A0A3N6M8J9_NATCH|nr:HalOD1 output domain-containing protein [Natrarchaeobius chitinivorans]RQG98677.1 hypothetical protein EA472_16950 [Natrarchaeobius chitinivorans]
METSLAEKNGETPVHAVIEAVAETTDSDPLDLPPLYEAVDPDALNTLFDGPETGVWLRFRYAGFGVAVDDEGVTVEPLREAL